MALLALVVVALVGIGIRVRVLVGLVELTLSEVVGLEQTRAVVVGVGVGGVVGGDERWVWRMMHNTHWSLKWV